MRIVLIGGHGKVALKTLPLLVEAGHEVTAWIRNPGHAPDVEALGARAAVVSVEEADLAAMTRALAGVDAVVWSAGAGGGDPARTVAVDRDAAIRSMAAAQAAGIRRYVMVSYSGAGRVRRVGEDNSFFTYQEAKLAADTHLRGTGLDYTILGPGTLTDEPSTGLVAPAGSRGDSRVTSRELVAQTIAAVLADERSVGLTLDYGDGVPDGVGLAPAAWLAAVAAGEVPGAEG